MHRPPPTSTLLPYTTLFRSVDVLPPHPKRGGYRLDFGRIQLAMEKVAARGGLMVVHAEDHDIVQFMYEKDRKSTRLNSSHGYISYAVFGLKKKNARKTDAG